MPQWLVIRSLQDEPKKISDISHKVGLSNSTISGIIDRLECSGYVKRHRDEQDRRIVWVYRTDKLEQLMQSMPLLQDSYWQSFLEGISHEDTQVILKSLGLLAHHMQDKVSERKK